MFASRLRIALPLLLLHAACAARAIEGPRPHDAPAPVVAAREAEAPPGEAAPEPPPVEPAVVSAPEPDAAPAPAAGSAPAFAEPVVPRERTRATVLAYHFFGPRDTALMVTEQAFEAQMRWLAEHRVATVTAGELASFLDGALLLPERVAVVTIDDANVSAYERAFPILRRYGIRFTLALNTAAIEGRLRDVLTWEMTREMVASGLCDLASHSHLHRRMDRLGDEANRREAELSRAIIEEHTGVRPDAFVFPLGAHSRRVREVLEEAGYRAAFGVGGAAVEHDSPRFQLPRVGVDRETTGTMFARLFSDQARRGKRAL